MDNINTSFDSQKSVLDISVRNPVTHNTWDKGRYTSYEIAVNTSNKSFCLSESTTRRRYSEFEWLRKTLKNHHPLVTPPQLPPKKYFGDRFDSSFIAFRMTGLEDFLNNLLLEKVFLSDTTMHLFLQTNLTIKEMKDYIEGKISAFSLDSLWKANGVKENCREFRSLSTTEENNEWAHVNKDELTKSENLNVDECRDSNNSDISSSFSDEEDRLTEYPSVTLVAYVNSGEHDSGVSSNTEKSSSPELLKPNSSQRTSETIHSDTTNVQVDFENDHQVSDNFSINTTKR
ncbi:sorting nexin-10-like isoform X1 [Mytilus edulis]|uniref:sorting nexin-10-like isoform X1 n=1 Tax=Mytilus edulis TaxID=6550 RepID=UPI0039F13C26